MIILPETLAARSPKNERLPAGIQQVLAATRVEAQEGVLSISTRTTIHEDAVPMLGSSGPMSVARDDDVRLASFRGGHSPALKRAPIVIVADATRVVIQIGQDCVKAR